MRTSTTATASPPIVHAIDPHGVYFPDSFQQIFRLRKSTIRREWKAGRLRIAKRAGRYYILGAWVLEWLRGGELRHTGPGRSEAV